jgi:hypothetical protein
MVSAVASTIRHLSALMFGILAPNSLRAWKRINTSRRLAFSVTSWVKRQQGGTGILNQLCMQNQHIVFPKEFTMLSRKNDLHQSSDFLADLRTSQASCENW